MIIEPGPCHNVTKLFGEGRVVLGSPFKRVEAAVHIIIQALNRRTPKLFHEVLHGLSIYCGSLAAIGVAKRSKSNHTTVLK